MNDYATLTHPDTVRIERLLPGPIDRVWRYLTDSELRGTWFCAGVMDTQPGGAFVQQFHNSNLTGHDGTPPAKYATHGGEFEQTGRVLAYEPPHRLAFTMGSADSASEVEFTLTPTGDQVLLVVTHRRLASRDAVLSVSGGWHSHLAILIARLQGTEPEGFWPMHTRLEGEYAQRYFAD